MNYAIIGCGLIGKKRLASLPANSTLIVACDTNIALAERLVKEARSGRAVTDFKRAVADPQVDAVIVATINSALAEISAGAIRANKHVLVEKPVGISVHQIDALLKLARKHRVCVRVGFNHRYHPGFLRARKIFESGVLGELMFVRARYGHGGRIDYDKEWRSDPKLSGGGELIDQGIHLIDLASWFLGPFKQIDGHASTYFWDMPVDDNGFLSLRTASGRTAWLHVSCTEWKNLFSFEIYGRTGKLHIEGLGGSYGVERLYYYKMLPQMGPPDTAIWEYPQGDNSWRIELREFETDIRRKRAPAPGLAEARAALAVVEQIYRRSGFKPTKTGKPPK